MVTLGLAGLLKKQVGLVQEHVLEAKLPQNIDQRGQVDSIATYREEVP